MICVVVFSALLYIAAQLRSSFSHEAYNLAFAFDIIEICVHKTSKFSVPLIFWNWIFFPY